MSNDNFVLTENAIKRHAKRLQTQMQSYNQDLSLGQSQTLLSKILGFNDWNHLLTVYKNDANQTRPIEQVIRDDTNNEFYQFVINNPDIEQEKKDLFIKTYEYFCNYKEEIFVGNQIYKNTDDLDKERRNNSFLVIDYMNDCIVTDTLNLFINKIAHINIDYNDEYLFSHLLECKAFKIVQYIIENKETKYLDKKLQNCLCAAAFYCDFERVKFLFTSYNIIITENIIHMACFNENVNILIYLINQYKLQNPRITDFKELLCNAINMSNQRANIHNLKYLYSLTPDFINESNFENKYLANLIIRNFDVKDKRKITCYKYKKEERLEILLYLIKNFPIKKSANLISLLSRTSYYKKALDFF